MTDWRDRAVCKGRTHHMYPTKTGNDTRDRWAVARALSYCAVCPVREPCLKDALGEPRQIGIRGGKTAEDRALILRSRPV